MRKIVFSDPVDIFRGNSKYIPLKFKKNRESGFVYKDT